MAIRRCGEIPRCRRRSVDPYHRGFRNHGLTSLQAEKVMMTRVIPILFALVSTALVQAQGPTIETAWNLIARGQHAQAVMLLRDIVKTDPRNADARLLLGSVLMEAGERSESIS